MKQPSFPADPTASNAVYFDGTTYYIAYYLPRRKRLSLVRYRGIEGEAVATFASVGQAEAFRAWLISLSMEMQQLERDLAAAESRLRRIPITYANGASVGGEERS